MSDTKILDRIKKLITLANAKGNTNECANAFAQAQRLLMKHKLTMADLDSFTDEADEPIEESDMELYGKRIIGWKRYLANEVAKLNACRTFTRSGYGNAQHFIVGRASDVEVVNYIVTSVVSQIEYFCKKAMKNGEGSGKTFSNQFKFGAAETVVSRIRQANAEIKKEYQGTNALVLVNTRSAEVDAHMEENYKLRKAPSYRVARDHSARDAGRAAGRKVSLSKGMKTTKAKGNLR